MLFLASEPCRNFWLVHTVEGQLFAFVPVSPTYDERVSVAECRYIWVETNQRFEDPCSGDKWELNGVMNLEATTEFWSSRNLDQYRLLVLEGTIFPQFHGLVEGFPVVAAPLVQVEQRGVVVTAVSADLSADKTRLNFWVQSDPIWEIDPNDTLPQQLLTYPVFDSPSLLAEGGVAVELLGSIWGPIVADGMLGSVRQMMSYDWEAVAPGTSQLTAVLRVELSNLHRQFELPFDWQSHKPGDVWAVDVTVPVGYGALHVSQVEWVGKEGNYARLRLTTMDASPSDLRLVCWQVDVRDPVEQTCVGVERGQQVVEVVTAVNTPIFLHLRTTVELWPFELTWTPE